VASGRKRESRRARVRGRGRGKEGRRERGGVEGREGVGEMITQFRNSSHN